MKRERRLAKAAIDGSNTSTERNLSFDIIIKGVLPFVSMSQVAGVGSHSEEADNANDARYNKAIATQYFPKPPTTDFKNTLMDPNDEERFTPIAIFGGLGTSTSMYLYHDNKYKDFLLVPELRTYGDTEATQDLLKNRQISIEGYLVGGIGADELDGNVLGVETKIPNIPKPEDTIESRVHKIVTYLPGSGNMFNNYGISFPERYLESKSTPLQDFISLGNTTALFNEGIVAYRAVNVSPTSMKYIYVGKASLDDVLIPLPHS